MPFFGNASSLEGDLSADSDASTLFDAALTSAVKRFQARHGLSGIGRRAARTLEALNVPAATRHRQLTASAQRLAGSTFAFGDRYVVVNIPSAAVEAIEQRTSCPPLCRRSSARSDRPSPIVETRVTAVNLNPTWTVPVSLIKKDIIPHVRKDPDYLAEDEDPHPGCEGTGGRSEDASTGRRRTPVNYTLRQDPGAINSLGQIRIDMPNKHAVYMHDTPKKQLFAQDIRFHSSGCVRVADVGDFAEWLLRGTNGSSAAWTQRRHRCGHREHARARTSGSRSPFRSPGSISRAMRRRMAPCISARMSMGSMRRRAMSVPEPEVVDVPATASIKPKRL